jgi:hypothetical protein
LTTDRTPEGGALLCLLPVMRKFNVFKFQYFPLVFSLSRHQVVQSFGSIICLFQLRPLVEPAGRPKWALEG